MLLCFGYGNLKIVLSPWLPDLPLAKPQLIIFRPSYIYIYIFRVLSLEPLKIIATRPLDPRSQTRMVLWAGQARMWCLGCRCQRINEPMRRLECYFKNRTSPPPVFVLLLLHNYCLRWDWQAQIKSETRALVGKGKEGQMSHRRTRSSHSWAPHSHEHTWAGYPFNIVGIASLHTSYHITIGLPRK